MHRIYVRSRRILTTAAVATLLGLGSVVVATSAHAADAEAVTALTYTGDLTGTVGQPLTVSARLVAFAAPVTTSSLAPTTTSTTITPTTTTSTTTEPTTTTSLPSTTTSDESTTTTETTTTPETTTTTETSNPTETTTTTETTPETVTTTSTEETITTSETVTTTTTLPPALRRNRALAAAVGAPVPDQDVTFGLCAQTCEGTTDSDGVATCTITPTTAGDPVELTVSFAGASGLQESRTEAAIVVAEGSSPTTSSAVESTSVQTTTSAAGPALANTGTPAAPLVAFGGLALLTGSLILLAVRTRRRPHAH